MGRATRFKTWVLATTVATYALIAVGALVRAAGAGLGCPDWPRCFGGWIPPTEASQLPAGYDPTLFNAAHTWLEYVNRLVGVTIGLLILATCVSALRHHRKEPHLVIPSVLALVLVGVEGWLGGRVVAAGLAPHMVTIHMLVAFVIVSLLLYAALMAHFGERVVHTVPPEQRRFGYWAVGLGLLVFIQVALGTEVRGALQLLAKSQPALPRGDWLPLGWWPDLIHRQFSVVILAAAVGLGWGSRRVPHRRLQRWNTYVLGLVGLQIAAGLGLAYGGVPRVLQVVHLAGASLLFGALSVVVFLALRISPEDPEPVLGAETAQVF